MELAVVILNWNAATETMRCIRAINLWEKISSTIWVVDNGSIDKSVESISQEFPNIHLVCNPRNLGFAGGNNQGIARAVSVADTPLLLLNNDAFIQEKDVLQIAATLETSERLGFVGPLLFDANDRETLLSAGGRDIAKYINTHIRQISAREPVREVAYVPGTVVTIRPEVFRTVGFFDAHYFFSGEMADLCERARQRGYISAIDARARAYHAQHDLSNLRETLYTYYGLRNRFLFIHKFRRQQEILLYSLWTLYALGMALKAELQNRPARARAICLAVFDGLHRRFGGQNERVLSTTLKRASPSHVCEE